MAVLQKTLPTTSPANEKDRYAKLVDAIHGAILGPDAESAARVAPGLSAFSGAAKALLDIRRFQAKAVWRSPFDRAVGSFLSNPVQSQARQSSGLLPDVEYGDCWFFETACIFLVKAALEIGAAENVDALRHVQIASSRADRACSVFREREPIKFQELIESVPEVHNDDYQRGFLAGEVLMEQYERLGARALQAAQQPYVLSFTLLRLSAHEVEAMLSTYPPSRPRPRRRSRRSTTNLKND